MQTRQLGAVGPRFGIATSRAVLDAGINLFNTGDFYGMGHNEMLLKFGAMRAPDHPFTGVDGRPQAVKKFPWHTASRRLLTASRPAARGDFRAHLPRFTGANVDRNQRLVAALADFAAQKGVTPAQLAIAWVAAKGTDIVPLIGARTRAQLAESLAALDVMLSPEDVTRLEGILAATPAAGTRYDAAQMRMLDSER